MRRRSPVRLTDSRIEAIVSAVRAGCTYETAAAAAGVDSRVLRRWLARGAREVNGPYVELSDRMLEAAGAAAVRMERAVTTAGEAGEWKAAAWWLERRRRAEYGRHETLHTTDQPVPAGDSGTELDLTRISTAELEELERLLAQATVPDDAPDAPE